MMPAGEILGIERACICNIITYCEISKSASQRQVFTDITKVLRQQENLKTTAMIHKKFVQRERLNSSFKYINIVYCSNIFRQFVPKGRCINREGS